jgi:hypothetical protein
MYRAPSSSLGRPSEGSARSLDDAIAGEFDFEIGEVFSEAWALTKGSKSVLLGGMAISLGVSMANQGVSFMAGTSESGMMSILALIVSLGAMAVSWAISAGMTFYAIKRAAGDPSASFDDVLSGFNMMLPIVGVMLLYTVIVILGFLLLILPGLYLGVGYVLAIGLKVERGTGVWESLETSRKAIHNCWFKMAGLLILMSLGMAIGMIFTLGIGLIWLLPFASLVIGVVYVKIFGYSGTTH